MSKVPISHQINYLLNSMKIISINKFVNDYSDLSKKYFLSYILDILNFNSYNIIIKSNITDILKTRRKEWIMNHVKEFRKNLGLSQLDLAKQIGVSRQTINMIENDKYNPTLELCVNIARALESDLNELFWEY